MFFLSLRYLFTSLFYNNNDNEDGDVRMLRTRPIKRKRWVFTTMLM